MTILTFTLILLLGAAYWFFGLSGIVGVVIIMLLLARR